MASKSAWWRAMGGIALALACPSLGCGQAENDGEGASGGQGGMSSGNGGSAMAGGATGGSTTGTDTPFDELKLVALGGYGASPPPGSTCDRETGEIFALTSSTRKLSWSRCAPPSTTPGQPWEIIVLEDTISSANLAGVESALANLRPNNPMSCGADAGVLLLDRVTPAGVDLFVDDFYSGCPWEVHKGRTFVTGLRELRIALEQQFAP